MLFLGNASHTYRNSVTHSYTEAALCLGELCAELGETAEAHAYLVQAASLFGCQLRDQGDLQAARDCFQQALEAGRAFADEHLRHMPVPGGVTAPNPTIAPVLPASAPRCNHRRAASLSPSSRRITASIAIAMSFPASAALWYHS